MQPAPAHTRSSWICRNEEERARLLAMHQLLVPSNLRISLFALAMFLLSVATLPGVTVLLLVASFGVVAIINQSLTRWERPELAIASAVAVVEAADCVALSIAHVQHTGGLMLLLWPLMSFNARYPRRVALAGTVFTVVALVATQLITGFSYVVHDPMSLTIPLAVVIAVATVASATRESDIEHTRRAVLDPLTGLLNRSALAARVRVLAQQSTRATSGVAVLVGDIDHFKSINDTHGHQAGDEVLRAVADRLRSNLRAFDLLYRLGGEEFVVLAPGASLSDGLALAERLRAGVSDEPVASLPVTMSWGVSVSAPGQVFDWDELYPAADRQLYTAKRSGRNRVAPSPFQPRLVA